MSIEKLREEFEAWLIFAWSRETFIDSAGDTQYVEDWVQGAWTGWQASRAELVIDLPQVVAYEAGYDSIRENEYASQSGEFFEADEVFALHRSIEVREAIEAAGVKVKP